MTDHTHTCDICHEEGPCQDFLVLGTLTRSPQKYVHEECRDAAQDQADHQIGYQS